MKRNCQLHLPRLFKLYDLNLYRWSRTSNEITTDLDYSFVEITAENYKLISDISAERLSNFHRMISLKDYGVFICVEGKPVGYGWAKFCGSSDYFFKLGNVCYLCRFYINPSFRGHNLYPLLIKYLLDKFKNIYDDIYISVAPENTPSIRGVAKHDFKFLCRLRFIRLLKLTFNKFNLVEV